MLYVKKVLRADEEIVAVGKMHWIIYFPGILMDVVGLALIVWPSDGAIGLALHLLGWLLAAFGIFSIVSAWFESWTTEIAVTTHRVIQKRGFIRRVTGEMNMQKVESVTVDQSILGRLLNYGTIAVRGTGAGIEGLHHIGDPLRLRSAIVAG